MGVKQPFRCESGSPYRVIITEKMATKEAKFHLPFTYHFRMSFLKYVMC
jgi:hypothetical protein